MVWQAPGTIQVTAAHSKQSEAGQRATSCGESSISEALDYVGPSAKLGLPQKHVWPWGAKSP